VEDCVTYVTEPENLPRHLPELARLAQLGATAILPNHGTEEIIARGGYGPGLIPATADYVDALISGRAVPDLAQAIAEPVRAGVLWFYAPYEPVHAHNLSQAAKTRSAGHWNSA
jgi:cyclase